MNLPVIFLFFSLSYVLLIWKSGKTYPILYLFFFNFLLQYIFSTYLIYNEYGYLAKQMSIPQEQYFSYAAPALFFLFAGVFLFNKDISVDILVKRIDPKEASKLGYLLLFISYMFDFIDLLGLAPISSIISFTGYLKYVAAICLLFSNSGFNYFLTAVIYFNLLFNNLIQGVFIDFFIWATHLFFFVTLRFQLSFKLRLGFIAIAAPVLVLVQSVKHEYRVESWTGKREAGVDLFTEIASKKAQSNESLAQSAGVMKTVGRLSQGWHLGMTLKRVPKAVPFSEGEEILNDIVSSILPRVIFADKKKVNSQAKFYKYTGHRLRGTTSMTIGLLGDFYVNFGRWGSYAMLFVFGAIIARMLHYFLKRFVVPDPINLIWIPFLLSYLIRADNDFYIFFNCLVKGILIFATINFIRLNLFASKKSFHALPGQG